MVGQYISAERKGGLGKDTLALYDTESFALGLLPPFRFGGCQGGIPTEPEDMGQEP